MAEREPVRHDGRAIEYVLGTLPSDERRALEIEMRADANLARQVEGWEDKLAPLTDTVSAVQPSSGLWDRISRVIEGATDTVVPLHSSEVFLLRRARARWRNTALAASALAAALAGLIGYEQVRERPAPTLLAVVNRDGNLPALVVRVDPRSRTVQVRSLAAETPSDRSLELWSVVTGQAPQSLGLVPAQSRRFEISADMARPQEGGLLAVSIEPLGGSTTGAPTGAVIYSGRLVPDAP